MKPKTTNQNVTTTATVQSIAIRITDQDIRQRVASKRVITRATGEVLLLTAVIFSGDGARSGLTSAMFVLVAASSLRCRPLLIGCVTVLTMLCYGLLWVDSIIVRHQPVAALTAIPMMLALALIGLIQYIAINRSSASLEANRDGMPRKNNAGLDRPKN